MSNVGLATQNLQWLIMIGVAFVVSVFLQVSQGRSAVATGAILTPATIGILLASTRAGAMARKFSLKTLIWSGFLTTAIGLVVLLFEIHSSSSGAAYIPGLLLIGIGQGVMLTASVNLVQSSFPESEQGEISGLSRCVSNLGSSLGTAIAGAILVSTMANGIARLTEASSILDENQKQKVEGALKHDFSAVSDEQVRQLLAGKSPDVVEEVTRINAAARDHAIEISLSALALIAILGFLVALLLPREKVVSNAHT